MNKLFILISISIIYDQGLANWVVLWEDHFDGGHLANNKWNYQLGRDGSFKTVFV